MIWPLIFQTGHEIVFAHTVLQMGESCQQQRRRYCRDRRDVKRAGKSDGVYSIDDDRENRQKSSISMPILTHGPSIIVEKRSAPHLRSSSDGIAGNKPERWRHFMLRLENGCRLSPSIRQSGALYSKVLWAHASSLTVSSASAFGSMTTKLRDATSMPLDRPTAGSRPQVSRNRQRAGATLANSQTPYQVRATLLRAEHHQIVVPRVSRNAAHTSPSDYLKSRHYRV